MTYMCYSVDFRKRALEAVEAAEKVNASCASCTNTYGEFKDVFDFKCVICLNYRPLKL